MLQYSCRYEICLFMLIQIHLIVSQTCRNSVPDLFYNVDFAGPFFNRAVYTIYDLPISQCNEKDFDILYFSVREQTTSTRPSYYSPIGSSIARAQTRSNDIEVRLENSEFHVVANDTGYSLRTKNCPLNYFAPYHRYVFNLIAEQRFPNREGLVISKAVVQITLKNDNIHAPMFIPSQSTFYLAETTHEKTEFGTVYATDLDGDEIEYSISHSHFSIHPSTGVLRIEENFFSSSWTNPISINITATDDGASCSWKESCSRKSSSTTIQIMVIPENRYSPYFSGNLCGGDISLRENIGVNATVESFTVWDNDQEENGKIDISFPSDDLQITVSGLRNPAYSDFHLDRADQTGSSRTVTLRTNRTFNYDEPGATRVWFLNIIATDHGIPPRQALCSLRINLMDINDNSPEFLMTSWSSTIYKSLPGRFNRRILRIIAVDADSGSNGQLNYYLGSVNVPYFHIERDTGIIILEKDPADFSSSDISRFPIEFHVYAQDRGASPRLSKNNATVTIFYSESNDLIMAQWIGPNYDEFHLNISEKFYELHPNQPISQEGVFDRTIAYELTSSIPSILTVNSPFSRMIQLPFRDTPIVRNGTRLTSGILVTSGLHAEIEERYFLSLRVLSDPPLMGSVIINIIDENDQIPTFDIRSFVGSVLENEDGLRILARIRAFDRDTNPRNNLILYKLNNNLSDAQTIEYFHVELNGTVWTNRIFRREDNRTMYRLFITAYNEESIWNGPKKPEQDFQFDVQVIIDNKNPPKFANQSLTRTISINETTARDTILLNLTIIDVDINTKLNLGIMSGNIRNVFTFTRLSDNSNEPKRTQYEAIGQLKLEGLLDYELTQNYTLVLFAFDAKNLETFQLIVRLQSENTKAPVFDLPPRCQLYRYEINESRSELMLRGPTIQAIDSDLNRPKRLVYAIYDPRRQLDLSNVILNQNGSTATIGINALGLSRDLPFGQSEYRFGIRVTDEDGTGVSSYAEASIAVIDANSQAPIAKPLSCIPERTNKFVRIKFSDYDDSRSSNGKPFTVVVVSPTNFQLLNATQSDEKFRVFEYLGPLNRSLTKSFNVTLNLTDSGRLFGVRKFSIIVCDDANTYPISDGSKTIKVIYVDGYQNTLQNADLSSVYVQDLNDWFRADRTYSVRSVSNNQIFNIDKGNLNTPDILSPGTINIVVDVRKPDIGSSAVSTIRMEIQSVDSEYVRKALAIRIRGEYPETMLGGPLDKLHQSLATLLQTGIDSIKILTVRPVVRYQTPFDPPKTLEDQKAETETDVVFYVINRERAQITSILKDNLSQFQSRFQIRVVDIAPDPCRNYGCPSDTFCRATRTIHPTPNTIDANMTSLVGINILDSADCVYLTPSSTNCLSASLLSDAINPSSPPILESIFDENNARYAEYDSTTFSSRVPTRFSFDFLVTTLPTDALILLYGRNSTPIDEFFWIAIEIVGLNLKFHFHNQHSLINNIELKISTWYHIECQFIHSTILASINGCQYVWNITANTTSIPDLSNVRLYLGGLPTNNSLVSQLYPSIQSIKNFTGRIRNVLSNGCYLNMFKDTIITDQRLSNVIVPWYTWLIIALVLLLLITILVLTLLTCLRRKQQMRIIRALYTDGTGENIIDYKDTAGEEDHSTYNLQVLKKPIFFHADGNFIPTISRSDYIDPRSHYRTTLGEYIDEKLHENVIPYANDTQLHYFYEGDGSIASNLSSLESRTNPNNDDIIL